MKRKLLRIFAFCSVFLVLLLSLQTVAAAEEPPMMSPGFTSDDDIIEGAVPVEILYHLNDGSTITQSFLPNFSPDYSEYNSLVENSSNSIYSLTWESSTRYYSFEYDSTVFYSIPRGAASCQISASIWPYHDCTFTAVEIRAKDFYYIPSSGNDVYLSELFFQMKYDLDIGMDDVADLSMVYYDTGSDEARELTTTVTHSDGYFTFDPGSSFPLQTDSPVYVESMSMTVPIGADYTLQWGGPTFYFIYQSYYDDYRLDDVTSYVPPVTPMDPGIFADYTSWIGTATAGFLDLELVQGFTIGGILMTIIGFLMAIWFLKLVAGG